MDLIRVKFKEGKCEDKDITKRDLYVRNIEMSDNRNSVALRNKAGIGFSNYTWVYKDNLEVIEETDKLLPVRFTATTNSNIGRCSKNTIYFVKEKQYFNTSKLFLNLYDKNENLVSEGTYNRNTLIKLEYEDLLPVVFISRVDAPKRVYFVKMGEFYNNSEKVTVRAINGRSVEGVGEVFKSNLELYHGDVVEEQNAVVPEANSGGRVNYYLCEVKYPLRKGLAPCTVECEDIINALEMTWSEGNMFKAIWRVASMRKHGTFKVGHDALYDAQKIMLYAESNYNLETFKREYMLEIKNVEEN